MIHSLAALEERLAWEQAVYNHPQRIWPVNRITAAGDTILDVFIIGGGQAGLAIGTALLRERIANFLIADENPEGFEGPWVTYARMITLRTEKNLTGPDAGFVHATFRAWYEAQQGAEAWQELRLIVKEDWMAYLRWVRQVFALPMRNDTRVIRLMPRDYGFEIEAQTPQGTEIFHARKVVVATGLGGSGGPRIPELAKSISKARWMHSSGSLDPEKIRGKRIAVVGGNASAFDNSAASLELSAQSVTHFVRRKAHPELNTLRYLEFVGLFRNFSALDDATKLAVTRRTIEAAVPPPPYSIDRCTAYANFELKLGQGWQRLIENEDSVTIVTQDGQRFEVDYIIFGTGFSVDLSRVGFLSELYDRIKLWRHQVSLSDSYADLEIAKQPYLGAHMECTGRSAEDDAILRNLILLNGGSLTSSGPIFTGINGMPFAARRVVEGLSQSLFLQDAPDYLAEFSEFEHSEFQSFHGKVANG